MSGVVRMQLRTFTLAAVALATWLLACPSSAHAQALDYQPIGVRTGSVLLFPVLKLEESFDDNIFKEESGARSSFITNFQPSLIGVTDWETAEIELEAAADYGHYHSSSADDYLDYRTSVNFSYYSTPSTTLFGKELGFAHLHEARGDDDVPLNAAEPTEFNRWGGLIGMLYKPAFVGLELTGSYHGHHYDDTTTIGGGAPIPGSPRDYSSYVGSVKVGYDIQPGYETFVRGTYTIEAYDQSINAGGFDRSSNEYRVDVGMAYEVTRLLRLEASAGYLDRGYDDPALDNIRGPSFNLDAQWSVTPLTTIGLLGYTRVEETISNTAAGKLVYGGDFTLTHELLPNLVLKGNLGYDNISYDGNVSNRRDNDFEAGLSATYWMAQIFFVGAGYEFSHRASNQPGLSYSQNVYTLTLGAQW